MRRVLLLPVTLLLNLLDTIVWKLHQRAMVRRTVSVGTFTPDDHAAAKRRRLKSVQQPAGGATCD